MVDFDAGANPIAVAKLVRLFMLMPSRKPTLHVGELNQVAAFVALLGGTILVIQALAASAFVQPLKTSQFQQKTT